MFIEFVTGPKSATREHLKYEVAAPLIAAGIAREVHLSEEEKKAIRFGVKPFVPPLPEWTIINSQYTGKLLIKRHCGTETSFFDGRPAAKWNCPQEIVCEFEARLEREQQASEASFLDRTRVANEMRP